MNLKQQLLDFQPLNEEEAANVDAFLQFIEGFHENIWTRDNCVGHVTVSAWVTNPARDKVLMAYHKIYNSYAWLGGHADGERDLLWTAIKEAREESGIDNFRVVQPDFIDVCPLIVKPHLKRGVPVVSHLHFNLTYWLEAEEEETPRVAPMENLSVQWLPVKWLSNYISEEHMKPIYQRLIEKTS